MTSANIVFDSRAWVTARWADARPYLVAAWAMLVAFAAPRWRAASAYGRATASAGWRRLPRAWQDRALDSAALCRASLMWLWLTFLSLATVWSDPMGWARHPIPVRIGRGRTPAAVHLAAATTPLQLRVAAYFWRNSHDHTCQSLHALLVRHGGDPAAPLDVSGTIVFPRVAGVTRTLPPAFRLQIDLVAKTFTLTHARVAAEETTGATVCAHVAVAAKMNSASVDDALGPLLGRRLCPALMAGNAAKID